VHAIFGFCDIRNFTDCTEVVLNLVFSSLPRLLVFEEEEEEEEEGLFKADAVNEEEEEEEEGLFKANAAN